MPRRLYSGGSSSFEGGVSIQGGRGAIGQLLVVRPGQALRGEWDRGEWGSEDSHVPERQARLGETKARWVVWTRPSCPYSALPSRTSVS